MLQAAIKHVRLEPNIPKSKTCCYVCTVSQKLGAMPPHLEIQQETIAEYAGVMAVLVR